MTAEETIKAVKKELRSFCERCENSCRNYDCNNCIIAISYEKATEALVLVKQQQAEIKKLEKARQKQAFLLCNLREQKYELMNRIPAVKNEAYKEFAKIMKDKWFDNCYCSPNVDFDDFIDDVLKELVGDNK